jgi:anti-sigma factor (TIGR02949 family)
VDWSVTDCQHVLDLLEVFVDREVGQGDCRAIEQHLAACQECADREDFVRRLREVVRRTCGSDALPPGLEERVRRAIAAVDRPSP